MHKSSFKVVGLLEFILLVAFVASAFGQEPSVSSISPGNDIVIRESPSEGGPHGDCTEVSRYAQSEATTQVNLRGRLSNRRVHPVGPGNYPSTRSKCSASSADRGTVVAAAVIAPNLHVTPLAYGAKCDGVTDDASAFNAMTTAYSGKPVTFDLPVGKICAVGSSVILHTAEWLTGSGGSATPTTAQLLALSGFAAGGQIVSLQGAGGYYSDGGITGVTFSQGSNTGLIAVGIASGGVLRSTFEHIRTDTSFGIIFTNYVQENIIVDVEGVGNTDQLLKLYGNVNNVDLIMKEGGTGTTSDPYVYISGSGNTLGKIVIEGTCSSNKPASLLLTSANQTVLAFYDNECNAAIPALDLSVVSSLTVEIDYLSMGTLNVLHSPQTRIKTWDMRYMGAYGSHANLPSMLTIDTAKNYPNAMSDLEIEFLGLDTGNPVEYLDKYPNVKIKSTGQHGFYSNDGPYLIADGPSVNGTNLLVNGSFDAGMFGWSHTGNGASITPTNTPSPVDNGLGLAIDYANAGSGNDLIAQQITITAAMVGHSLTFSGLAKILNSGEICPYFSGAGVLTSNLPGTHDAVNCVSAGQGWARIAYTFTPTAAGALTAGFSIVENGPATGESVAYLDDAVLLPGLSAGSGGGRFGSISLNGNTHTSATAIPTTGTWKVGDVVWNSSPTSTSALGWVNTTAGTPGAWTSFGGSGGLPNLLGCLQGYDMLPCTVYSSGTVRENSPSGAATVYTTTAAGIYRFCGGVYATTASSTADTVDMNLYWPAQVSGLAGSGTVTMQISNIGTGTIPGSQTCPILDLASGVGVNVGTFNQSGTNTGGAWNRWLTVERLQ